MLMGLENELHSLMVGQDNIQSNKRAAKLVMRIGYRAHSNGARLRMPSASQVRQDCFGGSGG